jgi:P27 family predicted phage terminase small subunit
MPPKADPTPPAGLEGLALEKWTEVVALFTSMGVFTQADRHAVQRYCLMYEQWWDLEKHCREHGSTQITSTGYSQVTAEATLVRSLRKELLEIERQFGMTPAARSSLKVSAGASAPENPLVAFAKSRSNQAGAYVLFRRRKGGPRGSVLRDLSGSLEGQIRGAAMHAFALAEA